MTGSRSVCFTPLPAFKSDSLISLKNSPLVKFDHGSQELLRVFVFGLGNAGHRDVFGDAAYIARARVVPLRNMGGALSPMNAFLILQGIETLPLRMDRTCENALAIARFLHDHPKVSWVNCAALPDHPDHALLQKYMNGKAPSLLSFGVKPSGSMSAREAGAKVLDAFKLFTRLVNIGDARSLATHSASTTHRQLSAEELKKAGVSEDMIRLSIGLEHADDLIADLDQALSVI